MKLLGHARRIELKPETAEDKIVAQEIIDGKATIFWGDSEEPGGALIISTAANKSAEKAQHGS